VCKVSETSFLNVLKEGTHMQTFTLVNRLDYEMPTLISSSEETINNPSFLACLLRVGSGSTQVNCEWT
jgi:hypothetical protein